MRCAQISAMLADATHTRRPFNAEIYKNTFRWMYNEGVGNEK